METLVSLTDRDPIAIVGSDQTVRVFNFETGQVCKTFATEEVITCMAGFVPLFTGHSGMETGYARFARWNPMAGKMAFEVIIGATPNSDIEHILHCPSRRAIVVGMLSGDISLWDEATGEQRAWLQRGNAAVAGSWGPMSWQTRGGDRLKALKLEEATSKVLACCVDGRLAVWNLSVAGYAVADVMSMCGGHAASISTVEPLFTCDGALVVATEAEPVAEEVAPLEVQPGNAAASWVEETFGPVLVRKSGEQVNTVDALQGKQRLGVYMGGRRCGYCPPFSASLKQFYERFRELDPKTEFIFVPFCAFEDESTYKDYFFEHHGDWLMMPWSRERCDAMSEAWDLEGVPFFITLLADGTVLNHDADDVIRDKTDPEEAAESGILFKPAQKSPDAFDGRVQIRFLQPTPTESLVCTAFGDGALFTGHCDRGKAGVRKRSLQSGELLEHREVIDGIIALEFTRSVKASLCAAVGSLSSASGTKFGTVLLLDPGSLELISTVSGFSGMVTCLRYMASMDLLVGGTLGGDIIEVDFKKKGTPPVILHKMHSETEAPICVVAPGSNGAVAVYDLASKFAAVRLDVDHAGERVRQGTEVADVENQKGKQCLARQSSFKTPASSASAPRAEIQEKTPKQFEAPALQTFLHFCHSGIGDVALASMTGGQISVWESQSGKRLYNLSIGGKVLDLGHCPKEEIAYVVTFDEDTRLCKFWSLSLGKIDRAVSHDKLMDVPQEWLRAEPITLDDRAVKMVVVCGSPAMIFLATIGSQLMHVNGLGEEQWASKTPDVLTSLQHRNGKVVGMAGQMDTPTVGCWAADTGNELWTTQIQGANILTTLLLDTAGAYCMCDHGSLTLMAWDKQEGKNNTRFHEIHEGRKALVDQVGRTWGGEEAHMVAAGPLIISGQIIHLRVWCASTGKILAQKDDLESWVTSICVFQCGEQRAQGVEDDKDKTGAHGCPVPLGERVLFYTGHRNGTIVQWTFEQKEATADGAGPGWEIKSQWQIRLHTMAVSQMYHKAGELWSMSDIKVVVLNESALERWHIVSQRSMDTDYFTNKVGTYIDGWLKFFKQLAMIWFTSYQLGCFGVTRVHDLSSFNAGAFQAIQMVGITCIPATYLSIFYGCLGLEILFVAAMYIQESVEWKRFMSPGNKFLNGAWLFCNMLAFGMSGPLFLPLFKYLMAGLMCSHGNLMAQPDIACWTPFHIWAIAVPAVVMMALSFCISYRLLKCGGQLENIDFQFNPFDRSGDIPVKKKNKHRFHRLVYRTTRYELVSLIVKILFASTPFYPKYVAFTMFAFGSLMLLHTDFTADLYWDVVVFNLNPSFLQAGLDLGLLTLFVGITGIDMLLPADETAIIDKRTKGLTSLLCCLPLVAALGYNVRKRFSLPKAGRGASSEPDATPLLGD
jgi:WD40 repeat protein